MNQMSQWVISQVTSQSAVFRLRLGLGLGLGFGLGLRLASVLELGFGLGLPMFCCQVKHFDS